MLLSGVGGASANNTGRGPLEYGDAGVPPQVAPEQDAAISSLTLTADGSDVALTPAFDPEVTRYAATVSAESVVVDATANRITAGFIVTVTGDTTLTLTPITDTLTVDIPPPEGQITDFSFTVRAEDGVTTKTYHIAISRPAADTVPDITIEANYSEYVSGLGNLVFTLTREGDTTNSLDLTVNLDQTQPWLTTTSHTVTFGAGDAEATLSLHYESFSNSVTQSGELTATVAPMNGYDTSGARVRVRAISQDGPAVRVALEHTEYTFDEGAGEARVVLVATAAPGVPYVPNFAVSIISEGQSETSETSGATANPLTDYLPVSASVFFNASDFQEEGGSLVGRTDAFVTIVDGSVHEGDELFHLNPNPPKR